MALDARDLEEFRKALNAAAGRASVLWTAFVMFALYLAITFGAVTHRDLFLETPVRLPVLNVDLPLVGFFSVAPVLLLIFHFYLCFKVLALAEKAREFNALLPEKLPNAEDQRLFRHRLDGFPILQFIAGPRRERVGFTNVALLAIAWITLVAAPLVVLLQGQLMFLPYQHVSVTWWQRSIIVLDLVIIGFFWSRIRAGQAPLVTREQWWAMFRRFRLWARRRRSLEARRNLPRLQRRLPARTSPRGVWQGTWLAAGAALTVLLAVFSIVIATFPGEWMYGNLIARSIQVSVSYGYFQRDRGRVVATLTEYLFEGQVDEVRGRPATPLGFSNRLVLPDQRFVDPETLDKLIARTKRVGLRPWEGERTLSLRGRDLRRAWLARADLRAADFTGARLERAVLDRALLHGAMFGCGRAGRTQPSEATGAPRGEAETMDCVQLQGASLARAQLQDAWLVPGITGPRNGP